MAAGLVSGAMLAAASESMSWIAGGPWPARGAGILRR